MRYPEKKQPHDSEAGRFSNVVSADSHIPLSNFESNDWHAAHATDIQEENKLIEAGFEFIHYSEKDQVAIYWKRK